MYTVRFTKAALKALRRIPPNVAEAIRAKVAMVADDPFGQHNNAMKLQGRDGYRLRVGDWRVVYTLENHVLVLLVIDIGPRGDIYQ